ncbi:unnamed protein product [Paramecium sonneborni]|uniref:Uncharacterized protein n=1 Tax=Paramecium sonneborni TaxID=65129 RepID=A0A8S1JXG8_9CILI|nr:unnamed protein product [Paramecium sonneborni]
MENNKFYELLQTYEFPEKKLKSCCLANQKTSNIKKVFPLEFGLDGITLLQRGPWTQQERDIYLQICQKHEDQCKQNQTASIFKEILGKIPTRNLAQLKGFHKINNPFPPNIIKKNNRIRRTKLELSLNDSDKLLYFVIKSQRKKCIKQQQKLANLNNQILTQQTQIVQFNLKEEKQTEVKIYINIDLLLNTINQQDQKLIRDEIKAEKLDCAIEEQKEQLNQIMLKKDKIIVSLRNHNEIKDEKVEEELKFINKSKKITFNELISKIEIESKLNHKKQIKQQNFWQKIDNSEQLQTDEVIIIEQQEYSQKEIKFIQVEQFQQQFLQQETFNKLEVMPQKKIIRIINQQKSLTVEKNKLDLQNLNENNNNPANGQIIYNKDEQFDFQQYLKKEKQGINQQIIQEDKSGQNIQIIEQNNGQNIQTIEQNKIVESDEDKNNQKENLIQLRKDKKENIQHEKILEEPLEKQQDDEKINEKNLQEQKRLEGEKKIEIIKQQEIEMQEKKQLDIHIKEKEIEKMRNNYNQLDKQNEIETKKKLESKKIKERLREEVQIKRRQTFNGHDKKERNRVKNRESRSLLEVKIPQNERKNNEHYEQEELKCSQEQRCDSSFEENQSKLKLLHSKGQEIINQQQLSAEILNKQCYRQDFQGQNQNQFTQDYKAQNQNQFTQDQKAQNKNQFIQDYKAKNKNQFTQDYKAQNKNQFTQDQKAQNQNQFTQDYKAQNQNQFTQDYKAQNQNQFIYDYKAQNQNQFTQDQKAQNKNQFIQDYKAQNQNQFTQDYNTQNQNDQKAQDQNQFQVSYIDQIQQQYFYLQNLQRNQFIVHNNYYKPISVVEGQYQNQANQLNFNQGINNQDKNSQFSQQLPIQFQNYTPYQDQAISQPQTSFAFQPSYVFIGNPHYYPQVIPVGQFQQQSLGSNDESQNMNKDQYEIELAYVFRELPQHFDPNFFCQYSPQNFGSMPGVTQFGNTLK